MQKHLLSVSQFTKQQVLQYIERASQIKQNPSTITFPNKTLLTMFYEPSTRTSCSFQAAAIKLGLKIISITDKYSSSQKGETLEDTIKTLNYYGDAIVLRHPEKGSAQKAAKVSKVPIINAGDGNGEHPTQALLDIMTIYTELKTRNIDITSDERPPITITFVGDLKNSRTIHSLIHLLALFPKIHFIYIAPPTLEMPEEIIAQLNTNKENPIYQNTTLSLQDAIPITDVLYMTRIQKERFKSERDYYSITLSHHYKNYCIDKASIQSAKKTAIIMHPLPRSSEIDPDVDDDPRTMYMTQVENGVYMRMAILEKIFSI
jgi:carbamoyl-phosphate synthase/aspartate carbamoyltransferase